MARAQQRAALVAALVLSAAAPCVASRRTIEAVQVASAAHRAAEDLEAGRAEGGSAENQTVWGFYCPPGLRANETLEVCIYDGPLEGHDGPDEGEDVFRGRASEEPLVFDAPDKGGVFKLESQFVSEMAAVLADKEVLAGIADELVAREMDKNQTFAEEVALWMHKGHELAENFKPVEFLVVHVGLHVALEVAGHGLHHLAGNLMRHGTAFVYQATLMHEIAFRVPALGVVLLPLMLAYDTYTMYHHYRSKTHVAKNFAARLVFKSRCLEHRIAMQKADAGTGGGLIRREIGEVCGGNMSSMLALQVQRSNFEMRRLLQAFQEVGRCLYTHGDRRWSKTNCVHAMTETLLRAGTAPGLLKATLSFAATYAQFADQVLAKPLYGELFSERFDIDIPGNDTVVHLLKSMRTQSLKDRVVDCMTILATHRAYERTFVRQAAAFKIWMRTYARGLKHRDIRNLFYSGPCKRVFTSLEDGGEPLCKDEQFMTGHGEDEAAFDESEPCKTEENLNFGDDWEDLGTGLWQMGGHHGGDHHDGGHEDDGHHDGDHHDGGHHDGGHHDDGHHHGGHHDGGHHDGGHHDGGHHDGGHHDDGHHHGGRH